MSSEPAPVVTEVVGGDLLALPPKASRISVGAAWHNVDGEVMDLDLSAIAFAEDGTLLDAAYFHNLSAANSAIRHMGDDRTGLGPEEQDDEVIHVYPTALPAEVKTIVITISATGGDVQGLDLAKPSSLQLSVYSSEEVYPTKEDDEGNIVTDMEADPIVRNETVLKKADLKHFLDQNESAKSLIVCALCKLKNSGAWTIQMIGRPHSAASWGLMIPSMKEALKLTPEAKGAAIQINPEEHIAVAAKADDRALEEMIAETHRVAPAALVQEPARTERLRFDLGWTYWPPQKKEKRMVTNEDGEEVEEEDDEEIPEPPALEYAFAVYDYKGERIATVDGGSTEADGIRVLGEDDLEKDVETGTGRDAIGFAVKASVLLELDALPQEARSIVVLVTQFSEGGFTTVADVHGRLVEVLPAIVDLEAKPKKSDDDDDEEEEAPPAKPRFRDLASYHVDSKEGADGELSTVAVCKLYREFRQSAYWAWRTSDAATLADFMRATDIKETLAEVQRQKKAKDEQEKSKDEDEEEEDDAKPRMKAEDWQWRARALGLKYKGAALEDLDRAILDLATYEGRRNSAGQREDRQAKCFFANGDAYYGEYVADLKHGVGMYIFANGSAFLGEYCEGKRQGQGVLMFPDGSCYEGAFVNDKFEGAGRYTYADGSVYIGQWRAGKKDGKGIYWYPGFESCLRGEWKDGYAHGTAHHETSRYQFEGQFDRGVPEGSGKFTISAEDRLAGQRPVAAGYLLHDHGPSLACEGAYTCPVPTEEDAPPVEEEEGAEPGPRVPNPELRKKNAAFKHKVVVGAGPVQVKDPVYPHAESKGAMPEPLAERLGMEQPKLAVLAAVLGVVESAA